MIINKSMKKFIIITLITAILAMSLNYAMSPLRVYAGTVPDDLLHSLSDAVHTATDSDAEGFTDINESDFFYDSVIWAYSGREPQIVSGISKNEFKPYNICNRAQVVTFLWRYYGCPEPKSINNPFSDVSADDFYYKPVLWAYENGITSGIKKNIFGILNPCSRAQFATMLWRAAGKPEPASLKNPFADIPQNSLYADAVLWAYEKKITSGKNATHFNPNASINRAQAIVFIYNYYNPSGLHQTILDGTDYKDVYDYEYYSSHNSDVVINYGDDEGRVLRHFVDYGMYEGRRGSVEFNVFNYICRYSDLHNSYKYEYKYYYIHYMRFGKAEGRIANGNSTQSEAKDAIKATTGVSYIDEEPLYANNKFVFIGDSRMFRMEKLFGDRGGTYIAQSSLGLDWMKSQKDRYLGLKGKYIIMNMGVNDMYNVDKYLEFYRTLPADFVANNKVIVLSVNPVEDGKDFALEYEKYNSDVDAFNRKIKENLPKNLIYMDSNTYLKTKGYVTYDGLHYDDNTNIKLYNFMIRSCNALK